LSTLLFPGKDCSDISTVRRTLSVRFVPLVVTDVLGKCGVLRLLGSGLRVICRLFSRRSFPGGLISSVHRDLHLGLAMLRRSIVDSIPCLRLVGLLLVPLRLGSNNSFGGRFGSRGGWARGGRRRWGRVLERDLFGAGLGHQEIDPAIKRQTDVLSSFAKRTQAFLSSRLERVQVKSVVWLRWNSGSIPDSDVLGHCESLSVGTE
jgi:hypothetical protein